MDVTLAVRSKKRTDTEQNWTSKNPILLSGETGYISSGEHAGMSKTGDGTSSWSDLPYDKAMASGGDADTVGGHTVGADVPSDFQQTLDSLGNVVYRANESSEDVTVPNPINADTLDGHGVDYFATSSDITAATTAWKNYADNFPVQLTHTVSSSVHKFTYSISTSRNYFPAFFFATADSKDATSATINGAVFNIRATSTNASAGNYDTLWTKNSLVPCIVDKANLYIYFFPRVPNIFVSSSEPTSTDGQDGDIWVVTE